MDRTHEELDDRNGDGATIVFICLFMI